MPHMDKAPLFRLGKTETWIHLLARHGESKNGAAADSGQVRSHAATITTASLRRRTGDGALLYTQTLLHSPVPRWENCEFVDRNFQLRFLVTIRRNAGQGSADRERAGGGRRAASGCRAS